MDDKLRYGVSIKLYGKNKAFGPGIATLLRNVEKNGSLQGAAAAMNMAYSKAWKILKETEKEWGITLTDRETGGKDGGGSTLTEEAREILEHYEAFIQASRSALDQLFEQHFTGEWMEQIESQAADREAEQ